MKHKISILIQELLEWDKGRKFGCELIDVLILEALYLIICVPAILFLSGALRIVIIGATLLIKVILLNRTPPDL